MIPSMIVFGLVFGRWWKPAILGGALLCSVLVGLASVFESGGVFAWSRVFGAAALGAVSTAFGVAIRQLLHQIVLRIRLAGKSGVKRA
ncbi:hypothetical protein ACSYDW_00590 [Paeniglutamicibacter sp. R2-26]|uniref:hypothetical protein n=1 Tax=Paeniglutamicibacter sp. R2-26 TaxID=3144417 RepID=UPI003EE4B21C